MIRVAALCLLMTGCTLQQIKDAEVVYCNPALKFTRSIARSGLTAVTGINAVSQVDVCETVEEMTETDEG
tara:strand:+ start:490 stop:699 length:210 start_codon:yes stop_codon:yes gene_type:complete